MALRVAEIQGVHHHADVGRVLARLTEVRDLDEFERGIVQVALEFLVAGKVTIGLLHDDVAPQVEAFEYLLDGKCRIAGIAGTDRNILQVEIDRHRGVGSVVCIADARTLAPYLVMPSGMVAE